MAVSRNTSSDESSEWCTVHDIQTVDTRPEDDTPISGASPLTWSSVRSANIPSLQQERLTMWMQRLRAKDGAHEHILGDTSIVEPRPQIQRASSP